jgi:hypothetical protein
MDSSGIVSVRIRYIPMDEEFEKTVNQVFTENDELFRKLAEYEAKERKDFAE